MQNIYACQYILYFQASLKYLTCHVPCPAIKSSLGWEVGFFKETQMPLSYAMCVITYKYYIPTDHMPWWHFIAFCTYMQLSIEFTAFGTLCKILLK